LIKRRQTKIRLSLPDGLDLMVICVEAGLGLDQALTRVSQEIAFAHPALSEELQLVTLETRAGRPRADALRNIALRTGVDDIRALVAVLVQTDRFGTSIAQALRVHSDSLRTERRQRAEEAAAKTTIKMVPVLVLCLFPAMFIVSLGPAAIQVIRQVRPMIGH
jgi:tight adherence protein C